ncbi:hypothetical protein Mal15_14010 [Stieleria maiorica]|uniref:Uncharacterized protein n=1 Tax=Stieleria maiorica TaxID=2795974 RepID=A0A5B9M868_9BACT|nr:hypothetical protein Mal15_14010 [Stieleria maiorica]
MTARSDIGSCRRWRTPLSWQGEALDRRAGWTFGIAVGARSNYGPVADAWGCFQCLATANPFFRGNQ